MLKDLWDSFKDNIKERTTNPFLGTFILVWAVHNWRIVYSFFFFDKEQKLDAKIKYFQQYWTDHSFIGNLFQVVGLTLCVLAATYFLLAIGRYLSNIFENRLIPFIYSISGGKTVTAEIHEEALLRIQELDQKVKTERNEKNEFSSQIEILENRLRETSVPIDPVPEKTNKPEKDYSRLLRAIDVDILDKAILGIIKEYAFSSDNSSIDFLLKHGLIELKRISTNGHRVYQFTNDGLAFKEQHLNDT